MLTGCVGQRWTNVKLEEEEVKKIVFLDITPDNKVRYTSGDKSYESKGGEKKTLDIKIISKFEYRDKIYYVGMKNEKVGIVDRELLDVVTFNYESIEKINDKFIKGKKEGEFYLIDIITYDMLGPYSSIVKRGENTIEVTKDDEKIEILDGAGNRLEDIEAKEIFFIKENKIVTRKDNLFNLYDIDKKEYISNGNQEIYFSGENILYKKDGSYYLNNKKIDIKRVYPSINDVVLYDYEKGFKLLNLKDLEYSKEIFEEIEYNYDKYIIVGKNGKYGVVNKYKQGDVKYEFDYIERVGANSFQGGTEAIGLFALVVEGKRVTEEKYEEFIEISTNYYLGLLDKNYYVINKRGTIILKCKKEDLIYYNKESIVISEEGKERVFLLESDE